MFVIQGGRVIISKAVGDVEKVLCTLGQGEFFGEMSILCDRPRSATATVAEDAKILVIDPKTFEAMVRSNAEVAIRMIKTLAERLQAADDQISNQLFQDGSSRIVHYLATAAARAARADAQVRLSVTGEQLPALVGVEPAQVEEVLLKLQRARIIALEADGIVIPEVAKLRHFLEFLQMKVRFGEAS